MTQQSASKVRCLLALTWALPVPFLLPTACGSVKSPDAGPDLPAGIFSGGASGAKDPIVAGINSVGGGSSGATSAGATGTAGTVAVSLPSACANVSPGTVALLDDFDDLDALLAPEPGREALWSTLNDGSEGETLPLGDFLPESGGAHHSKGSAHVAFSGYNVWGAAFMATMSQATDGIGCPYNASHFQGIHFYARGVGQVRVSLMVPEVVDADSGGTCRSTAGEVCYDTHGVWVTLGSDWKLYSLKWSAFLQRGFGKRAAFRPEALEFLQFAFERQNLPQEAWFDDVSWDDGSPLPDLNSGAAGEGGTGGDSGALGQGGASAEGGAGGVSSSEAGAP